LTARAHALIAFSVLMQAAAEAFLSGRISSGDSLRFSLLAFLGCTLLFLTVNRVSRTRHHRPAHASPGPEVRRLFAVLNVASAVTFLGLYVALVWVPAAFAASLMAGIGPIAASTLARLSGQTRPTSYWARSVVLFAASLVTAAAVQPSLLDTSSWQSGPAATAAGAALALIAGVGATVLARLSHRLGERGTAPSIVMAHRFHLTYVLAALALASHRLAEPPRLGWGVTALVAFGGVVVPLYALQIGAQRTAATVTMALLATQPGLAYLVQGALGFPLSVQGTVAVVLLLVVASAVARAEHRLPRAEGVMDPDRRRAAQGTGSSASTRVA
jgi:drug/metabolite transporter (DMT)-like permease